MANKNVLIVDDEKDFAEFVQSLLVERGYAVDIARDGQEGLSRIRASRPDLLILDMNMPKMGGIELYAKISSRYGRTPFPVIILTALGELSDFFQDALVDAFLTKPFQVTELLRAVERLLSGHSQPVVFLAGGPEETRRIRDALTGERFRVVDVDGPAALEKSAMATEPNFIALQYETPAWKAESWIRKIRTLPHLKKVPVIVYSNSEYAHEADAVVRAGADRYLGKLDDLKPLFLAIRQLYPQTSHSSAAGRP